VRSTAAGVGRRTALSDRARAGVVGRTVLAAVLAADGGHARVRDDTRGEMRGAGRAGGAAGRCHRTSRGPVTGDPRIARAAVLAPARTGAAAGRVVAPRTCVGTAARRSAHMEQRVAVASLTYVHRPHVQPETTSRRRSAVTGGVASGGGKEKTSVVLAAGVVKVALAEGAVVVVAAEGDAGGMLLAERVRRARALTSTAAVASTATRLPAGRLPATTFSLLSRLPARARARLAVAAALELPPGAAGVAAAAAGAHERPLS
jgi:hypothetical protein